MSDRFKVRGCCCGIPFGCGVFAFIAGIVALGAFAAPDWLSLTAVSSGGWLPF